LTIKRFQINRAKSRLRGTLTVKVKLKDRPTIVKMAANSKMMAIKIAP
jgi:hypothetical protein